MRRFLRWQREQMAEGGKYAPDIRMQGLASLLLLDVGIPLVAYYLARVLGASATWALIIATVVSGLRLAWIIARHRRIDAFAVFMLCLFAGGALLSVITGDARFLLLKNAYATIAAGLVFLASVALKRPLTFSVARRMAQGDPKSASEVARGWAESAAFRRGFYFMSSVWGVGLIIDGLLRVALILHLDLDQSVAASSAVQVVAMVLLGAWNVWFVEASRRMARRQEGPVPMRHASEISDSH